MKIPISACIVMLSLAFAKKSNAQDSGRETVKKYCYTTYTGKYVMTLFDDGTKKALFQLYNRGGSLQKTMQGKWMMRDEGVYGTAYMITISWTGLNAGMQELKFVAQFDGYGKLQAIIDSESRTWDYCH